MCLEHKAKGRDGAEFNLNQEVKVCGSAEHLKQELGSEGDDVVL